MSEKFGNYELLSRIAMGGMAEIWLAKRVGEAGFEKRVVIKRILPHYADDEDFMRMFLDEARIAALLDHPNIVQVNDFGAVDGQFFIAMEYVEGFDLRRVHRQMGKQGIRIGPNRVAQIGMAMAKGLGYAHAKKEGGRALGIVHRDISPHNVLISMEGSVKVMDFGIAKAASRASNTRTGVLKGKLAYMSPEQAMGEPVDQQTDIFSTGIALWELLSERRLFIGDSDMETLKQITTMEIPRVDAPATLADAVARMLDRDRHQRYATMRDVERDLAKALHEMGGAHHQPLDAMMEEVIPADWLKTESISDEEARDIITNAKTASGSVHARTRKTRSASGDASGRPTQVLADDSAAGDAVATRASPPADTTPARVKTVPTPTPPARRKLAVIAATLMAGGVLASFAIGLSLRGSSAHPVDPPTAGQPASRPETVATLPPPAEPAHVSAPTALPTEPATSLPALSAAAAPQESTRASPTKRAAKPPSTGPTARVNLLGCPSQLDVFANGKRVASGVQSFAMLPIGKQIVYAQAPNAPPFTSQRLEVRSGFEADYECRR